MSLASKSIVVGSTNKVKIEAARDGFVALFKECDCVARGVAVPSGVADQPITSEETLRGAEARALGAQSKVPGADYYLGIEGGIQELPQGMEVFAWIVICAGSRMSRSKTGSFFLPPGLVELIRSGLELGHADDTFFGRQNSKQDSGSVGILTDNAIDRRAYYAHAVTLAFIPFLKADIY